MKRFLFSLLVLLLAPATGLSQDEVALVPAVSPAQVTSRKIELLPNEKVPLVMRDSERNPFARRSPAEEEVEETTDGETQGDQIRRVFESLTVTGISRGPRGLRALVGDMILGKGYVVPQMLRDQTEFLIVSEVTENEIKLSWVNLDTNELTGKDLTLGFDLEAKVRSVLAGSRLVAQEDGSKVFFERKIERERRRAALVRATPLEQSSTEIKPQPTGGTASTAPDGLEPDIYLNGQ